jgi:hypothetical protein
MIDKNLGLVLEPPKRRGMDNPVPVALKYGPGRTFLFRKKPAPAFSGLAGKNSKFRAVRY